MYGLTALERARIQFGLTMSSHIIFPAITDGAILLASRNIPVGETGTPRPGSEAT